MPVIYRPTVTQPIPRTATLVTENGVTFAVWGAGRRQVRARVNAAGTRCSRRTSRWWIEYRDAGGRRIRRPGYHDRKATEALAAALVRQAERAAVGLDHPGRDPRDRLPTLGALAERYRNHLAAVGDSVEHVRRTHLAVDVVLKGLHLADVEPGRADGGPLANWLAVETSLRSWSPRTRNKYAAAVKAFGAWIGTDAGGRHVNPFPQLAPLPEKSRTITRRALTMEELSKLIDATKRAGVQYCLNGPDRAMLYVIASYTGFRIDEIAHLETGSFIFENKYPIIVVLPAKYSKRRQDEAQPIPAAIRRQLCDWLKDRAPGRLFVDGVWNTKGATLIRADLELAGVTNVIGGRRVDFHSLRVTYVTNLARAGVPLQHAQKLARHSTPVLTANIYTDLERELDAQADRLPGLGKGLGRVPRDPPVKGHTLSKSVQQSKNKKPLKSSG